MRVNRGQEFVIGGYTRGTKTFDALVFGDARARSAAISGRLSSRVWVVVLIVVISTAGL
jgi:hypothetical protein